MSLVTRNGRTYFYRCYRDGGRPRCEYAAAGRAAVDLAAEAAEERESARRRAAEERGAWEARKAGLREVDRSVAAKIRELDRAVSRALEDAGYHRPSRELRWLRKRGAKP